MRKEQGKIARSQALIRWLDEPSESGLEHLRLDSLACSLAILIKS
jgi:hypothetical protein